jgi:keratin-associated protein 17-1
MMKKLKRIFTISIVGLLFLFSLLLKTNNVSAFTHSKVKPDTNNHILADVRLSQMSHYFEKIDFELNQDNLYDKEAIICTPASANPVSVCLASGCAGSVCIGSGCGVSYCIGSACASSLCAGSGCAVSNCGGSACGASICAGSACGISGCAGSLCVGCRK